MSGKRGSNPRPSALEADALPLSYSRMIECKNTNYLNMLSFVSPEINQYPISQNVLICLRK
jgi:hypothetical protein